MSDNIPHYKIQQLAADRLEADLKPIRKTYEELMVEANHTEFRVLLTAAGSIIKMIEDLRRKTPEEIFDERINEAAKRAARYKANNERRKVRHDPMNCSACGRSFVPKRTDAVTCSNRCRQALHRQRASAAVSDAFGVG
jgi:predicted nucleic acid-binding Zn ribbon protein